MKLTKQQKYAALCLKNGLTKEQVFYKGTQIRPIEQLIYALKLINAI